MSKRAPRTPAAPPPVAPPALAEPTGPVDKRVKVTFWIRDSIAKAMKHECIDRDLSFGELVEEAMQSRTMVVRRG